MDVLAILRLDERYRWGVRFTAGGEQLAMHRSDGEMLLFSLHDVLAAGANRSCEVVDVAPRQRMHIAPGGKMIGFSAEANLITVRYDPELEPYGGHRIHLWDLSSGSLAQEFIEPQDEDCLADIRNCWGTRESPYPRERVLCGGGRFLVSGSVDKNLFVYDLRPRVRLASGEGYLSALGGWYERPRFCFSRSYVYLSKDLEKSGPFGRADLVEVSSVEDVNSVEERIKGIAIGGARGTAIFSTESVTYQRWLHRLYLWRPRLVESKRARSLERRGMLSREPSRVIAESTVGYPRLDALDDFTALSWDWDGQLSLWDFTTSPRRRATCEFRSWEDISSIDVGHGDAKLIAVAVTNVGLVFLDPKSTIDSARSERLKQRFGIEIRSVERDG